MFRSFRFICFLTLQTNLKHVLLSLIYKKSFLKIIFRVFNIIDELDGEKETQMETVRREGSEFH